MEPILASLEVRCENGPVRVAFAKSGDMISHTLFLINGEEKTPVLTSQISAPNLPCFTELHQQDDMLFLTGADGPCHWSMSVARKNLNFEHNLQSDAGTLQLLEQRYGLNSPQSTKNKPVGDFLHFDLACRLKEPVAHLGNQYLAVNNFQCDMSIWGCVAMAPDQLGVLHLGGPESNVTFVSPVEYSVKCDSKREIFFSHKDTGINSFPTTLRWSYGVWRMK